MAEKKISPKAATPKSKKAKVSGKTAESRQTKRVARKVAKVSLKKSI